jgi:hypothetical protein
VPSARSSAPKVWSDWPKIIGLLVALSVSAGIWALILWLLIYFFA